MHLTRRGERGKVKLYGVEIFNLAREKKKERETNGTNILRGEKANEYNYEEWLHAFNTEKGR